MFFVSYNQERQTWSMRVGGLSLDFDSAVVTPQGKFDGEGLVGVRSIHGLVSPTGATFPPHQLRRLGVGQGSVDRRALCAVHLNPDGTWEGYSV